jgi:outer membrane protein assembly factor BamD (BamD/ComL family)
MTYNRGRFFFALLVLGALCVQSGCASIPSYYAQDRNAANAPGSGDSPGEADTKGGWFQPNAENRGRTDIPRLTPGVAANAQAVSSNRPAAAASDNSNSQNVVQASALEPVGLAGTLSPAKITNTIVTEPIGEDTSRDFPVSVLPPQPPITTAGPQVLPDPPPTPASLADPMKDKDLDFWSKLAPEYVWKSIKKATGNGPNEAISRAAFKDGQELFKRKKFAEAAEKFKTAADRWPDTPLEEDALFMLGESYFFSDQYSKAHDTYSVLLKKHNNSRHMDIAVQREFAIGRYWEKLQETKPLPLLQPNLTDKSRPTFDTFGYAIQAYQNVRMYDPTGPLADDSLMASAVAYFRRGKFENAAEEFDLLRKEYPNSEHQKAAHILGLQAKMRVYQGQYYDPTALKEAGEIADQTLAQFGAQLGAEQARVAKARKQIIEEKANRDYAMAQYYEKQKYYGAARIYYRDLIEQYPSTERAKDAKARLDAIKGEPDVPPNYFKWLTGLFPNDKR